MSAHAHHQTSEEKVRMYFKVFFALFVITILEVSATRLPGAKIIRDTIITVLACTKAGCVGYFYMHLNHETKWLKFVALLPLIMFVYSAVLIPDTAKNRPTSAYLPLRPRIFAPPEEEHKESLESAETSPEAGSTPEAPVREVVVNPGAAASNAVSVKNEGGPAAPSAPTANSSAPSTSEGGAAAATAPATAPAAGGDDWK